MKKLFLPVVALLTINLAACENTQDLTAPTEPGTTEISPALNPLPFEPGQGGAFSSLTLAAAPSMGDCGSVITDTGTTWELTGNCITTTSVVVPDGYMFDLAGYTVKGVGDFAGAIITNAGTSMYVKNGTVTADVTGCKSGADRLRGVMLEGALGSVEKMTITNIHRGPNGCQEGNGIEVRNAPFDGTHPNTQHVTISFVAVKNYQKTGIVNNGDVNVATSHVIVGRSAAEDVLAPNGIQYGFGATGVIRNVYVEGVQWKGTSNFASAALLVYEADDMDVSHVHIRGNSDIGIYAFGDNGRYRHNDVRDEGADHPNSSYDIGVGGWGSGNTFYFTRVCGFDVPFDPNPLPGRINRELPAWVCR